MTISVLFLGDVVSSIGVAAIRRDLDAIKKEHAINLVVVNGENATGGVGIDAKTAKDILSLGVDCITLGDHTFSKKDLFSLPTELLSKIIRPANYAEGAPGCGWTLIKKDDFECVIINMLGRIFTQPILDCPFLKMESILSQSKCKITLVDFHAEATSEKYAMGRMLDGRVSVMVGTHTHVQTADEQIFEQGTGYITDLGMTGPADGVIGMSKEVAILRFKTGLPHSYTPSKGTPRIQGIIAKIEKETGKCVHIERINKEVKV